MDLSRIFKDIERGIYRAIIISPEQLMKEDGHFERLLKSAEFQENIIGVIIDEGHCINTWGKFRPEYREIQRLRYRLRKHIPFAIASATFPVAIRDDVIQVVRLRTDNLVHILRSTDRPNIQLTVRKIENTLKSFRDLAVIVPRLPAIQPPKFLIFFDSIVDSMLATKFLWSCFPAEPHPERKIKWFNSQMSDEYKEAEIQRLKSGTTWGLCTTDSFGLGMDITDISLVIQYRLTCDTCALWQRIGRAARNPDLEGVAIVYVENKHFDATKKKKNARASRISEKRKRKRKDSYKITPAKRSRVALSSASSNAEILPTTMAIPDFTDEPEDGNSDESNNDSDSADDMDLNEELRALYSHDISKAASGKKKVVKILEPAMDDFVNAGGPDRKVKCRRKPLQIFFGSDKAVPDHHLCDPTTIYGCRRCFPFPPRVCCDLHDPTSEIVKQYPPPIVDKAIAKATRAANKRSILKPYIHGEMNKELRSALRKWRVQKVIDVYGEGTLIDLGPGLILPIDVIHRIVDCIHDGKIDSVEALRRETKWGGAEEYGNEVLEVARPFRPTPKLELLTTTQPMEEWPSAAIYPTPKAKRTVTCGSCGRLGHTKRSRDCENNPMIKAEPFLPSSSRAEAYPNTIVFAPFFFPPPPAPDRHPGNPTDALFDTTMATANRRVWDPANPRAVPASPYPVLTYTTSSTATLSNVASTSSSSSSSQFSKPSHMAA
ncbi:hypothetical protein EW026_g714 [Hermanssonia centrifuga]|uniref:DNA 3'-5' helicase n=1 Tax=Hermanssonia centrifuga TaxID=98765 RepID=A0A4S4KTS6_9APHY|nr:hypothetical protein EW026_g714 [Hermanssonia centrifuga]